MCRLGEQILLRLGSMLLLEGRAIYMELLVRLLL